MSHVLGSKEIAELLANAKTYAAKVIVRAVRVGEDSEWTTARGDVLHAAAGDWWVIDGEDRWSVGGDVFVQTYAKIADDRYRKVAQVSAIQVTESVTVQTLEGTATGEPGDWLVRNPSGECWPVPAAEFARRYEEA